jgi:hypothetical protein
LPTIKNLELTDTANRYTLWAENGPQDFLCWGKAPYPYEVYRPIGHHMFTEAIILEATKSGSCVTRIRAEAEPDPDSSNGIRDHVLEEERF